LERIDEFLSRDDGAFYAERIQVLRRIMFGDLPEDLVSTPHLDADSLAPAHSALRPSAPPNSFRHFPNGSSLPERGGEESRIAKTE
jgi:hypothetical protein